MSTLATANLSSDESDADFVPIEPKPRTKRKTKKRVRSGSASGSGSGSSSGSDSEATSSGEEDDASAKKKAKSEEDEKAAIEERRRKAREEFEKMKAEAAEGTVEVRKDVETVEIKRARRFAGETIYETVKLPATDPEAVAYYAKLAEKPMEGETKADPLNPESTPTPATTVAPPSASPAPPSSASPAPASSSAPPLRKGPPPRKKRQTLEQMSAALDKGKKMTTLEKSQMDWKSHTSSSDKMADELAANRRNGGYLDKQDFLDRVGERRAEAYDNHLASRKR
ncbi:hypothetical protein IAT38_005693 [Cryptococcus sp. DSM 104549]